MRVRGGKLEIRKKLRKKSARKMGRAFDEPTLGNQGWGTRKEKKRKG
jgi:hypothetical protein